MCEHRQFYPADAKVQLAAPQAIDAVHRGESVDEPRIVRGGVDGGSQEEPGEAELRVRMDALFVAGAEGVPFRTLLEQVRESGQDTVVGATETGSETGLEFEIDTVPRRSRTVLSCRSLCFDCRRRTEIYTASHCLLGYSYRRGRRNRASGYRDWYCWELRSS